MNVALLASCLSHLSAHCGSDSSGLPADVHVDVIVVLNTRAAHQGLRRLQSDESPRVGPILVQDRGTRLTAQFQASPKTAGIRM